MSLDVIGPIEECHNGSFKNIRQKITYAQKWYLACIIYRNYYNDKTNLCGYKFDCKISKTEKKITKIARTVIKVFSYPQKASLFGNSKIFL